jgi:hypothetical protein
LHVCVAGEGLEDSRGRAFVICQTVMIKEQ